MGIIQEDAYWMQQALMLAQHADTEGEVPIGAVIVRDNHIIGQGWNQPIGMSDPSAHAEIVALRLAAKHSNNYRLPGTTLYVTLEPCAMCAGAIIHARVARVVFAVSDKRSGAAGSVFNILQSPQLNHRVQCDSGILEHECKQLLQAFFQERR